MKECPNYTMEDLVETCEDEGRNYTREEIKAWLQKRQEKNTLSNVKKRKINKLLMTTDNISI